MSDWGAVAARARGLVAGLRLPATLPDDAVAGRDALVAAGVVPRGTSPDPSALDRAAARLAADRLAMLARWAASAGTPITALVRWGEVDGIRALLRGAAAAAEPAQRLAAIVPTEGLPRRVLERAARLDTPPAVAALLAAAGHPAGPGLVASFLTSPSLRAAEQALALAWGHEAAARVSRRDGPLDAWRRAVATAWTLWEALAVADGLAAEAPVVVPGTWPAAPDAWAAARDGRTALVAAVRAAAGRAGLPPALDATLAAVVATERDDAGPGEESAWQLAMLAAFGASARRDPTSSAPVVLAVLRLRAARAEASRWAWRRLVPARREAAA